MKKKNLMLQKKLFLTKEVIAQLNSKEQHAVKGGAWVTNVPETALPGPGGPACMSCAPTMQAECGTNQFGSKCPTVANANGVCCGTIFSGGPNC